MKCTCAEPNHVIISFYGDYYQAHCHFCNRQGPESRDMRTAEAGWEVAK